MRRFLLSLTMLACIGAGHVFGAERKPLSVGDVPPDVVGKDREGAPIRLGDSRGKVVVLSFWASWCPPCRKELPILENVQRKGGAGHIKVIGISYKEDAFLVRKLLAKMKDVQMTFTRDPDGSLAKQFGLKGPPLMIMIGRDGRIASIHTGYSEDALDQLVEELNRLLEAPAAAIASAS